MRKFYYNERNFNADSRLRDHNVRAADIELIKEYLAYKVNTDDIKPGSERRIVNNLIVFLRYIDKPISELAIKDVMAGVAAVKKGYTAPGPHDKMNHKPKPLEKNTIRQVIVTFKGLLKWASRNKYVKITLEEIEDNVKAPAAKDMSETINPEEILTESEIIAMAQNALTERDRSLLLVTYETGARIGEISQARWEDAIFETINERETVKFYIRDSKDNKKRYARLTLSAPNLIALKNVMKPASESDFIFVTRGEQLQHTTAYHIFQNCAKRAGITKPVNPHAFRHARATNMLKQGWSETVVKKQLWNNVNTPMLKVYVALGNDAIDAETFKKAGIKEIREIVAENPPENRVCPKCYFVNNSSIDYCGKCGTGLIEKAINEKQAFESELMKELEFLKARIDALSK
jgi:site-specific recombinase XerD